MKIESGSVVRVRTNADCNLLAVVKGLGRRLGSTAQPGFIVTVAGEDFLAPETSIMESNPTCPVCSGTRWWWTEEPKYCPKDILCARCHVPARDWNKEWKALASMIDRLPREDRSFDEIRETVKLADEAFLAGDWARFQQITFVIRLAIYLTLGDDESIDTE